MAKLYLPITLIQQDDVYKNVLSQLYYMGIVPSFFTTEESLLTVDFLYQDIFPKMINDGIRIDDLDCWIEIDKALLNEVVLESDGFVSCTSVIETLDDDGVVSTTTLTKTVKDYVLHYKENDNTALILASHVDFDIRSRTGGTTSEELYAFLNKYADETMSNCYVEDVAIAAKFLEYDNVIPV